MLESRRNGEFTFEKYVLSGPMTFINGRKKDSFLCLKNPCLKLHLYDHMKWHTQPFKILHLQWTDWNVLYGWFVLQCSSCYHSTPAHQFIFFKDWQSTNFFGVIQNAKKLKRSAINVPVWIRKCSIPCSTWNRLCLQMVVQVKSIWLSIQLYWTIENEY